MREGREMERFLTTSVGKGGDDVMAGAGIEGNKGVEREGAG